MEDIEALNTRLKEFYGRLLDGRGRFRLAWSDEQLEYRHGQFRDLYGHIIIREVVETRLVKKYAYINPPCWVLEKLVFYRSKELPNASQGTYEPVWAFKDKDKNPLQPNWKVIEIIMWHVMNPTKRTDSDFKEEVARADKEEISKFLDIIDNEGRAPWAAFENAVNVSTNQLEFRRNR
jgi:hypothetical protein